MNENEEQVSVVFVDDIDFFSAGVEATENMTQILKIHAELFQAISGRIQYKITICFS